MLPAASTLQHVDGSDETDPSVIKHKSWWSRTVDNINNFPTFSVMRYVYKKDKTLLFMIVTFNFVLPPALDWITPWYLNPNQLLMDYLSAQSDINNQMTAIDPTEVSFGLLRKCMWTCMWYTTLKTLDRYISGRLDLKLRMTMRRLILEKILYSEIGVIEKTYSKTLGTPCDPKALENRLLRDMNDCITIAFVNIPKTLRVSSTLANNLWKLYWKKEQLSWVLVLYPFIFYFVRELVGALTTWETEDRLFAQSQDVTQAMSKLMGDTVHGLAEIQIMNYGEYQLKRLDGLIDEFMASRYGIDALCKNIFEDLRNHSIIMWVFDVMIEWKIRSDRWYENMPLSHKEYIQLKHTSKTVFNGMNEVYKNVNFVRNNIDRQIYIQQVLDLPGYKATDELILQQRGYKPLESMKFIEIKYLYFSYEIKDNVPKNRITDTTTPTITTTSSKKKVMPFVLEIDSPLHFEKGKRYGICGRNESGKSSLVDILCKLKIPQKFEGTFNGNYDLWTDVGCEELRDQMSYIMQRPFLFEGTIGENIHIANPKATIEEVFSAATKAGVLLETSSINTTKNADHHGKSNNQQKDHRGRKNHSNNKPFRKRKKRKHEVIAIDLVTSVYHRLFGGKNKKEKEKQQGKEKGKEKEKENEIEMETEIETETTEINPGEWQDKNKKSEKTKKNTKYPEKSRNKTKNEVDYQNGILNSKVTSGGKNLSGGLAQSVALARAYLRHQGVHMMICDESFSAMDTIKKQRHIYPELMKFVEEHNMSLIVISHHVNEIFPYMDQVIVMDKGHVLDTGTHEELKISCMLYKELCGMTDWTSKMEEWRTDEKTKE